MRCPRFSIIEQQPKLTKVNFSTKEDEALYNRIVEDYDAQIEDISKKHHTETEKGIISFILPKHTSKR